MAEFFENAIKRMRKKASSGYRKQDFTSRYYLLFWFLLVPEFIALCLSAFLSFRYYYNWGFMRDYVGDSVMLYVAIFFTCAASFAIWFFTRHLTELFFEKSYIDEFMIVLIVLIGWNVYTDWNGATSLAENVHQRPSYLQAKEDSINNQINNIYFAYRWCSKHGKQHAHDDNCKHQKIPTSSGQLYDRYERFGHNPKSDRNTVNLLETQLKRLNSDYQYNITTADQKREKLQGYGQGSSIICLIIFLFCSLWRNRYDYKVKKENKDFKEEETQESEEAQPTSQPDPAPSSPPTPPTPPKGGIDIQELINAMNNAATLNVSNGKKVNGHNGHTQKPDPDPNLPSGLRPGDSQENTPEEHQPEDKEIAEEPQPEENENTEETFNVSHRQLPIHFTVAKNEATAEPAPETFNVSHLKELEIRACEMCRDDYEVNIRMESSGKKRKYCDECAPKARAHFQKLWKERKRLEAGNLAISKNAYSEAPQLKIDFGN
jgi:hypothetical protein